MKAASRYAHLAAMAIFGSLAGGCVITGGAAYHDHGYRNHGVVDATVAVGRPAPVYIAPPPPPPTPVIVYQEPPRAEQVFVVRAAPPPVRVEAHPRAPAPGMVWISGYWAVQRGNWVWVAGRWDRPPRPHAVWVPHRWEKRGTEFHLTVGGWR